MRLSRLIALFAAAALGFGGVAAASPASAAPPSPNPVQVTQLTLAPTTIGSSTNVYAKTAVSVSAHPTATSWYVYADVYVNGVLRDGDQLVASKSYPQGSAYWLRSAGIGTAQLRNVRVTAYGSGWSTNKVAQTAVSNVAPVRTTVYFLAKLNMRKKGSKMKVKLTNFKVYQPDGSFASLGKVALQRKKKGKWRSFKKIKVNAAGKGKIKFTQSAKKKYRAYVPTTATVLGGYTKGIKIRIVP